MRFLHELGNFPDIRPREKVNSVAFIRNVQIHPNKQKKLSYIENNGDKKLTKLTIFPRERGFFWVLTFSERKMQIIDEPTQ